MLKSGNKQKTIICIIAMIDMLVALCLLLGDVMIQENDFQSITLEYFMEFIALSLITYYICFGMKTMKLSFLFYPCIIISAFQLISINGYFPGYYGIFIVFFSTAIIASASYISLAILLRKERGHKLSKIILFINLVMSGAIWIYCVIYNLVDNFSTLHTFDRFIPLLINVVLFLFLKAYPQLRKDIESASTAHTVNASSSLGTKLANLKTLYEQGLITEEQYMKDRSEYIEKY